MQVGKVDVNVQVHEVLILVVIALIAFVDAEFVIEYADRGRIRDSYGRERLFHGLNVVVKGPPWRPDPGKFDPLRSLCDTDIQLLKSWGMNVVRLGIMWPGLEDTEGSINTSHLEAMVSIVRKLNSAGIYTLIEFHQDLFSSQFCGEGLPPWILRHTPTSILNQNSSAHNEILPSGMRSADLGSGWVEYAASFPEPLSRRWFPDPDKATDSELENKCQNFEWFWYYMSYAVSRAFQDLYENAWGWADRLADYWKVVAKAFSKEPGVLGFELMNEPWVGNMYSNPLLLLPGVADKTNLVPFYDKLQAAIRSVDSEKMIFFESITFDNFRTGFSVVPGGDSYKNKTVLSDHYYRPPNFSPHQTISERLNEGKKLGCGTMLTEFFINPQQSSSIRSSWTDETRNSKTLLNSLPGRNEPCEDDFEHEASLRILRRKKVGQMVGRSDSVEDVLAAADAHVQSWIGWAYKPFVSKTGSEIRQSVFNASGSVNMEVAKRLARSYPQAVFGDIVSFSFDQTTAHFFLTYRVGTTAKTTSHQSRSIVGSAADGASTVNSDLPYTTEIFVSKAFYYASGIDVKLSHDCLQAQESENQITIFHADPCVGKLVQITVTRKQ